MASTAKPEARRLQRALHRVACLAPRGADAYHPVRAAASIGVHLRRYRVQFVRFMPFCALFCARFVLVRPAGGAPRRPLRGRWAPGLQGSGGPRTPATGPRPRPALATLPPQLLHCCHMCHIPAADPTGRAGLRAPVAQGGAHEYLVRLCPPAPADLRARVSPERRSRPRGGAGGAAVHLLDRAAPDLPRHCRLRGTPH